MDRAMRACAVRVWSGGDRRARTKAAARPTDKAAGKSLREGIGAGRSQGA
jgi:hypothetical protein